MEIFQGVLYGFQVALQPINLLYCFIGVFVGTLVGVLPGIGPAAAIALLLPSTFAASPVSAIIMLAGVYYGAMYGGSTTSILVNIPGEAASVVTAMDGYAMARQGRAGPALGISAFGSFIAGTLSVIALTFLAPLLARVSLSFGPPEYFALMLLGITLVTYFAQGSMLKALMMASAGLLLGTVGADTISGRQRFVFGIQTLADGIGLVPVIMGLFGISEVLLNLEQAGGRTREIFASPTRGLLPNREDWRRSAMPILRGSILGFFLGILPGSGAIIASFASYAVEKRASKTPERFGTGMIEGVAGPEAANNAAAGGGFIPLLTLGIPANAVMAILLGALMIHGLQPGPLLVKQAPDVFWGIITSMYVGNVMLLVLNLPLIGLWVRLLKTPYQLLFPLILLFCLIGTYSLSNNVGDGIVMLVFGILGYLLKKFDFEGAPLILAMVIGPMMEEALRQSLILSAGSFTIFLERPISAGFILAAALLLILPLITRRSGVAKAWRSVPEESAE
ncbi:MAG TPA: tripartite tricarboxylate transporter permease [Candidatus Binatia bacterium]|jgi:putative tricarboxylic transport membrane protein|nr:tripartite tricarboxylate transporter permease [Candidatus Binatia bacterium]